jgi:hypothetical protein
VGQPEPQQSSGRHPERSEGSAVALIDRRDPQPLLDGMLLPLELLTDSRQFTQNSRHTQFLVVQRGCLALLISYNHYDFGATSLLTTHIDRRTPGRRYCVGNVAALEDVPASLESVSQYFILFLAIDAAAISDDSLQQVAAKLIDRGMAYLCVWGRDCSRVHDQFDLERDPDEQDGHCVMTTWHSDESLSEALWFFANNAYPDGFFEVNCRDWVAISVGNLDWEQEIKAELIDRNEGWPP